MMRSKAAVLYLQANAQSCMRNDLKSKRAVIDQQMDVLGRRLVNVRNVLSRSPHGWANSYWSSVESRLLRQLNLLQLELA
jgi:hypothetical protein